MTDKIKTTQKEEPDLYKRSLKGGFWVFSIRLATQLFGLIQSVIVFNYLYKENLPLLISANMLMAALSTLSESGFQAALVQKKENITDYLDTAWVINILRGLILFSVMFFMAPWIASIKTDPNTIDLAVSITRVMAICFLIRSFQNIGIVYFQKEMQFHKTFWLTMTGTITNITLSILFVMIYRSIWGYVAAQLAASVVNLSMSYLLCSYRPKFHFVPQKARELWLFGKWLFSGNIIGYLLVEGDDWFVRFFVGPNPLMLYRYAYRFSNTPATHISNTISQVSFPAYSKIQHDIPRLRQAYLKVLKSTSIISVPAAFLIFAFGPEFIHLFLIEEARAMSLLFQILAFKGLLASISATWPPLFRAIGKPRYILHIMFICIAALASLIYPLTKQWGIEGTAVATILAGLTAFPYGIWLTSKLLSCSPFKILHSFFFPIVASALMAVSILFLKSLISRPVNLGLFIGLIMTALLLYILYSVILDLIINYGFRRICMEQLNLLKDKIVAYRNKT